ncbi:MAG: hypothetical protein KAI66_16785, partial [Lentisphaeria bacterium]|nr:hypothetical protein [Lentisphaeria bacterium]
SGRTHRAQHTHSERFQMPNPEPPTKDDFPQRKYPAHPSPIRRHNAPVILFVTVGIHDHGAILANEQVHDALVSAWLRATHWRVGYYMVMPEHIHLFCAPGVHAPPKVRTWVKYWKRLAGEEAPVLTSRWQKDCWDTQMRNREHYLRKLEYVGENPVRRGLAEQSGDWPYAGRLNELRW